MSTPASTTNLVFRHMFGVNSHVVDNISYTDDDTIVYVAGKFFYNRKLGSLMKALIVS